MNMLPFRRVLCPIDFSPISVQAVQAAGELAAHFDAKLCLIHVLPPPTPMTEFSSHPWPADGELSGDPDRAEHKVAEANLRSMIMVHVPHGVHADSMVRRGDATLEIVRAAESEGADLIVVVTHGATGWKRLFAGSVAEEEVRLAPCPVLCLHAREQNSGTTKGDTRTFMT